MKLLITGGAGFIGAHVLHHFCKTYPEYEIYCLDSLSYAAHEAGLLDKKGVLNRAELFQSNEYGVYLKSLVQ